MNMVWEWYNVGKTTINRPQFHHFYRWYGYHFQMCGFWHSCSHMNGILMGILDGKYHHGHFAKGLDINPFSIQKIHDVWICTSFFKRLTKSNHFQCEWDVAAGDHPKWPSVSFVRCGHCHQVWWPSSWFPESEDLLLRFTWGIFGNDPPAKYIKQIIAATPIPTHPATLRLARTSNN